MNRRITESKLATFVTFLDQIKVQFNALRIEMTSFGGKPALRARLPDSLMRLQRRNFYRVRWHRRPSACNAKFRCRAARRRSSPCAT